MTDTAPARAITKSVTIDRPTAEVHQYLADARNWPQWSVINVLAIDATSDPSWWQMTTPAGRASCASGPMPPPGCSITDFRDPQASWTVPARVVPKAAAPGSSSRSSSPHPMTRGVRRVARVHHPPGNGRAAGIPRGQRGRSRPAALYAGLMAAPPAPFIPGTCADSGWPTYSQCSTEPPARQRGRWSRCARLARPPST